MLHFWSKHKENIVLGLLLISCFTLISSPLNQHVRILRFLFLSVFNPGQKISSDLIRSNQGLIANIYSLLKVRQENLDLQEQVYRLREQVDKSQENVLENERLRAFLQYGKAANLKGQLAKIIGTDTKNGYTSIWVDKGSADGVVINTAALGYQKGQIGLAGRVIEVWSHTSRFLLLTDQESEIRVINQRSRADGILKGENSRIVRMKYFLEEADLQPGDVIITSGKGGLFPAGVKVASVDKVFLEHNKLFKGGFATVLIDPTQLEDVVLLEKK